MATPLSSAIVWRSASNRAEFKLDSWTGSVDLAHPARGVEVNENSSILHGSARVLGIEVGQPALVLGAPVDSYVREADLVAIYPESTQFPFGIQIYWSLATRDVAGTTALQIDLMVSIQTQKLDVRAQLAATSSLASSAAWHSTLTGAATTSTGAEGVSSGASRLTGDRQAPWILAELTAPTEHARHGSYVEATLPNDFLGAELELAGGALAIHRRLLDETMEKGVIRRLSCRGIFVRESVGPVVAEALYHELFAEKPRLTT